MESAKLVNLIEVIKIVGDGTRENPTRKIIQYWTLKGKLLFTIDDTTFDLRDLSKELHKYIIEKD